MHQRSTPTLDKVQENLMALTYFPVTATLKAVNTDSSADIDGNPDTQYISSHSHLHPQRRPGLLHHRHHHLPPRNPSPAAPTSPTAA